MEKWIAVYTKSRHEKVVIQELEKKKIIVTFRRSRGQDIDAACGQLANKEVSLN